SSARPQRRTTRAATPPTQPSSAAAVGWLIAERSALPIISQFNDDDDEYVPHSKRPPGTSERLAAIRITDWFWPKFVRNWPAACAMSSCGDRPTHVQPTTMSARLQAQPPRARMWGAAGPAPLLLHADPGRA